MTLIRHLLLTPSESEAWRAVICWWEMHRIHYNLLMLPAGILGLLYFVGMVSLYEHLFPAEGVQDVEVAFAPILGALGANICYTAGWAAELVARAFWRECGTRFGPVMWMLGTLFSFVVCFFPGTIWAVFVVARFVLGNRAP